MTSLGCWWHRQPFTFVGHFSIMISSATVDSGLIGSQQKRPTKKEDIEELMKGSFSKQGQEDVYGELKCAGRPGMRAGHREAAGEIALWSNPRVGSRLDRHLSPGDCILIVRGWTPLLTVCREAASEAYTSALASA